jgi:hypothetical protein
MLARPATVIIASAALAFAETGCGYTNLEPGLPSACYDSGIGCQYGIISQGINDWDRGAIFPNGTQQSFAWNVPDKSTVSSPLNSFRAE